MQQRSVVVGLAALLCAAPAGAQQYYQQVPVYQAVPQRRAMAPATPPMVVVAQTQHMQRGMGGGFIEFLFGDDNRQQHYGPPPTIYSHPGPAERQVYAHNGPLVDAGQDPRQYPIDPIYERQEVVYHGQEPPGTIVIDTPNRFLYLVQPEGRALRYGIGVGRPGFTWSGEHKVSAKKEWPDWVPPKEMLQRQPYLPHFMPGGPNNPLGARALYLGSTLYRIHGSNEPWTIGQNVSSGCIRMRNEDVVDLYGRVNVGANVVVL